MERKVPKYQEIYEDIRKKIYSGIYPKGAKFPSRSLLCSYYRVSEITIRQAVKMLTGNGFIQTFERKTPIVVYEPAPAHTSAAAALQGVSGIEDVLKTLNVILPPIFWHCLSLFEKSDWLVLEKLVDLMSRSIDDTYRYWTFNRKFWDTILQKGQNKWIVRLVERMVSVQEIPIPSLIKSRKRDVKELKAFVKARSVSRNEMKDFSLELRRFFLEEGIEPSESIPSEQQSVKDLLSHSKKETSMYRAIFLDLVLAVEHGNYKKGDYLPSHSKLRKTYQVSNITVTRVLRELREMGLTAPVPGKGTKLLMDSDEVKSCHFAWEADTALMIQYAEILQFLSLTVERAARHAMENVTKQEARLFYDCVESGSNRIHAEFTAVSVILLRQIIPRLPYFALREVYSEALELFTDAPGLLLFRATNLEEKNLQMNRIGLEAASSLKNGDLALYLNRTALLFHSIFNWFLDDLRRIDEISLDLV